MESYTCPICHEVIERDMMILLEHTNHHIIEDIKKKHPDWVDKDGVCPKCVEYYKEAKKGKS